MRIVGYARVSSRDQAENTHALEQQIARLEAAGATEIFHDVESGLKEDRTQFRQLLSLVETRQVDVVVFTRIDRMSRSLPMIRKVVEVFRKAGVAFRVLDDNIDTTSVGGKFHLNLLGALAEMEVDSLSERVKKGFEHRRKQGKAFRCPFGYVMVDGRLTLDKEPFLTLLEGRETMSKADIARDIIEHFLQHRTLEGTLKNFNLKYGIQRGSNYKGGLHWSRHGLHRWLLNPALEGHTAYLTRIGDSRTPRKKREDWEMAYNTHPNQCLLSADEAELIRRTFETNKRLGGFQFRENKLPLSGLVHCGACGSSCAYGGNPQKYYQCLCAKHKSCINKKMVRVELIEETLIQTLISKAEELAAIAAESGSSEADKPEPKELTNLKNQLLALEQIPGFNAAIEEAKTALRQQIESVKLRLLKNDEVKTASEKLLISTLENPTFWRSVEGTQKQDLYRLLVHRILINQGSVVVTLKL